MLQNLSNTNANNNSAYINKKISDIEKELETTNTKLEDLNSLAEHLMLENEELKTCVRDGVFENLDTTTFSSREVTTDNINPLTTNELNINAEVTNAKKINAENISISDDITIDDTYSLRDQLIKIDQAQSTAEQAISNTDENKEAIQEVQNNLDEYRENQEAEIETKNLSANNASVSSIVGKSANFEEAHLSESTITKINNSFRVVKDSTTFVEPTVKDRESYYLFHLPAKIRGTYQVVGVNEFDEVLFSALFIVNSTFENYKGMNIVTYSADERSYFYQIKKDYEKDQLHFLTKAPVHHLHVLANTVDIEELPTYDIYPSLSTVPEMDVDITVEQSNHTYIFGNKDDFSSGVSILGSLFADGLEIDDVITGNLYLNGKLCFLNDEGSDEEYSSGSVGDYLTVHKYNDGSERPFWEERINETTNSAIDRRNQLITEKALAEYDGTVGQKEYEELTDTLENLYSDWQTKTNDWYKDSGLRTKITDISKLSVTQNVIPYIIETVEDGDIPIEIDITDPDQYIKIKDGDSISSLQKVMLPIYLATNIEPLFQFGYAQIEIDGKWYTPKSIKYNTSYYLTQTDSKGNTVRTLDDSPLSVYYGAQDIDGNTKTWLSKEDGTPLYADELAELFDTTIDSSVKGYNKIPSPDLGLPELRFYEEYTYAQDGVQYKKVETFKNKGYLNFEIEFGSDTITEEEWNSAEIVKLNPLKVYYPDVRGYYVRSYSKGDTVERTVTRENSVFAAAFLPEYNIAAKLTLTNEEYSNTIKAIKVGEEWYYNFIKNDGTYWQSGNISFDTKTWSISNPAEITEEDYNSVLPEAYDLTIENYSFWSSQFPDSQSVAMDLRQYLSGETDIEWYPLDAADLDTYVTDMSQHLRAPTYAYTYSSGNIEYLKNEYTEHTVYVESDSSDEWTDEVKSIADIYTTYKNTDLYTSSTKNSKITQIAVEDGLVDITTEAASQSGISFDETITYKIGEDGEPVVDGTIGEAVQFDDLYVQLPVAGWTKVTNVDITSGKFLITRLDNTTAGPFTIPADLTVWTFNPSADQTYPIRHLGSNTTAHGDVDVLGDLNVEGLITGNYIIPISAYPSVIRDSLYRITSTFTHNGKIYSTGEIYLGKPSNNTLVYLVVDDGILNKLTVKELEVLGDTHTNNLIVKDDVAIHGDLYVAGTLTAVDEKQLETSGDYIVTRDSKTTGLANDERSGLVVNNYASDKLASIAVDKEGIWRISAESTDESTVYNNISVYDGKIYSGLSTESELDIKLDILTDVTGGELDTVVVYNNEFYHYTGADWIGPIIWSNNNLVGDIITDESLIATLESETKHELVYYESVTSKSITIQNEQAILTRDEDEEFEDGDLLVYDKTNQKATHQERPISNKQVLVPTIDSSTSCISYNWRDAGQGLVHTCDFTAGEHASPLYCYEDKLVQFNGPVDEYTSISSGATCHVYCSCKGDLDLQKIDQVGPSNVYTCNSYSCSNGDFYQAVNCTTPEVSRTCVHLDDIYGTTYTSTCQTKDNYSVLVSNASTNDNFGFRVTSTGLEQSIDGGTTWGPYAAIFNGSCSLTCTCPGIDAFIMTGPEMGSNIEIGKNAFANTSSQANIAIGDGACIRSDTGCFTVAIGCRAWGGKGGVAIGALANICAEACITNVAPQSVAVGFRASTIGSHGVAIGACSLACGDGEGVAIGFCARVTAASKGIAIGSLSCTNNGSNIVVIGNNAAMVSALDNAVIIGTSATSNGQCTVTIGTNARTYNTGNIAIGYNVFATGVNAIAIGHCSVVCCHCALALGVCTCAGKTLYSGICIQSDIRKGSFRSVTLCWNDGYAYNCLYYALNCLFITTCHFNDSSNTQDVDVKGAYNNCGIAMLTINRCTPSYALVRNSGCVSATLTPTCTTALKKGFLDVTWFSR